MTSTGNSLAEVGTLRIDVPRYVPSELYSHRGLERTQHTYRVAVLLAALPNMRYIHVIRHGVDMAFSRNQSQVFYGGRTAGDGDDIHGR